MLSSGKVETEKHPNPKKKGFSKFCAESSLHGWSYLNHEMNQFWKILWILFLFLIVIMSVVVVVENVQKYLEANR
jgi:hypothetical protein